MQGIVLTRRRLQCLSGDLLDAVDLFRNDSNRFAVSGVRTTQPSRSDFVEPFADILTLTANEHADIRHLRSRDREIGGYIVVKEIPQDIEWLVKNFCSLQRCSCVSTIVVVLINSASTFMAVSLEA